MAAETGAFVHGVDLSVNMVLLALERASASRERSRVSFEIADVTALEAAAGSYDVIYSRDTILHIHDKPALFRRCGRTPRASRPASRARAAALSQAAACRAAPPSRAHATATQGSAARVRRGLRSARA